MVYSEAWEKATCYDWYEDEKNIWLCLENKNAICVIEKKSKDIKILGSFPHNGLGEGDLSLSVIKCDDHIVFCPFKANDIAVLDIYKGELEFIDLLQNLGGNEQKYSEIEKFYRMISYKNYVYFLGIKYPAIMRLDLKTKKIELFNEWLEEIEKNKCKEAVLFTDGYAQKGDEVYLPIGRCNGVLKINLNTMEWKYIRIKFLTHGILGMTQKRNYIWLTEYDVRAKKFFQWNLDSNEITQIDLPCQDAFYAPLYCNKTLLFFQNLGNKSYQYDLKSGDWKEITSILPELNGSSDKKVQKNKISYFANKDKRFYHWDLKNNIIYYEEIRIKEKEFLKNSWNDYCKRCKQEFKDHIVKEGKMSIKDYIEIINTVS